LRAKFRNDSNFLVREIGRRRDVEERSLEMTEVSREVEEGDSFIHSFILFHRTQVT